MLGLTFTLKYQDAPHSLDGISITSMETRTKPWELHSLKHAL